MNLVSRSERSRSSKEVARYLQDKMQDIAGCEITAEAANMMSQRILAMIFRSISADLIMMS